MNVQYYPNAMFIPLSKQNSAWDKFEQEKFNSEWDDGVREFNRNYALKRREEKLKIKRLNDPTYYRKSTYNFKIYLQKKLYKK
jgi:hypothetical protein